MVLANYVRLEPMKWKCMRFKEKSGRIEERIWRDPVTGIVKTGRALVFDVMEEDGVPVSKVFSTLSEKLASKLWMLHETGEAYTHRVCIRWTPRGYATEYEIRLEALT